MNNMKNYIQKELSNIPPKGVNLKVGDRVRWVNDFGVVWEHKIIGFNTTNKYNRTYKKYVHLDTDSYWFPHSHEELTKLD